MYNIYYLQEVQLVFIKIITTYIMTPRKVMNYSPT